MLFTEKEYNTIRHKTPVCYRGYRYNSIEDAILYEYREAEDDDQCLMKCIDRRRDTSMENYYIQLFFNYDSFHHIILQSKGEIYLPGYNIHVKHRCALLEGIRDMYIRYR